MWKVTRTVKKRAKYNVYLSNRCVSTRFQALRKKHAREKTLFCRDIYISIYASQTIKNLTETETFSIKKTLKICVPLYGKTCHEIKILQKFYRRSWRIRQNHQEKPEDKNDKRRQRDRTRPTIVLHSRIIAKKIQNLIENCWFIQILMLRYLGNE